MSKKNQDLLDPSDFGTAKRPATKKPVSKPAGIPVSGWYGLALLFVCISIGYANYMVFFGTDDLISRIMLIPSTLFVVVFLLLKSVK